MLACREHAECDMLIAGNTEKAGAAPGMGFPVQFLSRGATLSRMLKGEGKHF